MPDPFDRRSWQRRPRTPYERRALLERTLQFTRFITNYPTSRRQQYIRYVTRQMEAMHYPAYVIRRAIRSINDGRDPRFSFGNYNDLGDGTYAGTYDD